jgi:hypothetical protein
VNTPIADFSALVLPLVYAEGGRMRWGAILTGASLYCAFGMSASMWVHFSDLETSSKVGMGASAAWIYATAMSNWLPIQRFVPRRVCAGIGCGYFAYHAYGYSVSQRVFLAPVDED